MAEKKINPRHQEFVRQYFLCKRNATEAYRAVYPDSKNPEVNASKLLITPNVSELIAAQETKVVAKFDVKFERIIEELAAISFGNMADLFQWDHITAQFIPKDNLTRDQMKFIDSIQVEEKYEEFPNDAYNDGDDPDLAGEPIDRRKTVWKAVKKFKIGTLAREKVKAMELMSRLLGYDKGGGGETPAFETAMDNALAELDREEELTRLRAKEAKK